MKLLTRYLIRQLSSMTLYALLALLALYSFFDIISEVGDIGQGSLQRRQNDARSC